MKVKVIKTYEAEIFELSGLGETRPNAYVSPFYVVAESREDITVDFEFQTRRDILRKNGKPQIFHRDLSKAQEYKNYNHALATANKMKSQNFNYDRSFYVVGSKEAKVIQMDNELKHKKTLNTFDFLKQGSKN